VDAFAMDLKSQLQSALVKEQVADEQTKAVVEIYGLLGDMQKDAHWYYSMARDARHTSSQSVNIKDRIVGIESAEIYEMLARNIERRRGAISVQMRKLASRLDI